MQRFAAVFDARKHFTPKPLAEKPENMLLTGQGEQPHQPSPTRSLISWAWNRSMRKSPPDSTHHPRVSCLLWIHPKRLPCTDSMQSYLDKLTPPCAIAALVHEAPPQICSGELSPLAQAAHSKAQPQQLHPWSVGGVDHQHCVMCQSTPSVISASPTDCPLDP